MKTNMKLTAVFVPDDESGYTAYIEEIPGVITQGETLEKAKINLLEALNLVMEARRSLAEKDLKMKGSLIRKHIKEEIFFA